MNPKRNRPADAKIGLTFCTANLENIFAAAKKIVPDMINKSPVLMPVKFKLPTETKYIAKMIVKNNPQNGLESRSFRNKKAKMAVSEVVII